MLRIIVRTVILLCLFAAPVVAIACTPITTTVHEEDRVLETKRETIPTGD